MQQELAAQDLIAQVEADGGLSADKSSDDSWTSVAVVKNVAPAYPLEAMKRGEQGWVLVKVDIDSQGQVVNAEVLHARPEKVFDKAVLRAAREAVLMPVTDIPKGETRSARRFYEFHIAN